MKLIGRYFFKGFIFFLPLALTLFILYWLGSHAEAILGPLIQWWLPDRYYTPGLGIVAGVIVVIALGLLVEIYFIKYIFNFFEKWLLKLPFVKPIYTNIKSVMKFFSSENNQDLKSVVLVSFGKEIKLMGFVTNENVTFTTGDDLLAVYFPMSYQMGGYVAYLPQSRCELLDIPVHEAMKKVLTADIADSTKA